LKPGSRHQGAGAAYYPLRIANRLGWLTGTRSPNRLRVLLHHDVPPDEEARFAGQLAWLKRRWRFVSPGEFSAMMTGDLPVRGSNLFLTFDDGFGSNRLVAERVLKPLKVVNDKIGSLTYAKDLLAGIHRLLETDAYGTYHMANTGACSRYGVALGLRDLMRLSVPVEPVSSAMFPLPAPRPRSEALRNLKIELMGLPPMRPWRDALADYVTGELAPVLAKER